MYSKSPSWPPCHKQKPLPPTFAYSQQGGITILTVLGLLVVATVLAFNMTKTTLRDLSTSGTIWQAAKASEASEAGLDWFLLWTNKENADKVATDAARKNLVAAMQELNSNGTWQASTYLLDPTKTWDRAMVLRSTESDTTEMRLKNTYSSTDKDFLQAQSATPPAQSFDLVFRYLGKGLATGISSGAGSPAGPNSPQNGRNPNLYQAISTGKVSIETGTNTYMRYQALREMYLTAIP